MSKRIKKFAKNLNKAARGIRRTASRLSGQDNAEIGFFHPVPRTIKNKKRGRV